MNDDTTKQEASGEIIDFKKKSNPHAHERKEKKLKEIQEAFRKALPLKKMKAKKKKNKKKK